MRAHLSDWHAHWRGTLLLCVLTSFALACGGSDVPGGGDAGDSDGAMMGPDAPPPECAVAADCDALFGAPPCGAWECNGGACMVACPNCTDVDGDGFGMGTGCAGPDCDDADDTVIDNSTASCYSGPPGTETVGTCRAGTATCTAGVWTPCTGEVDPSGEACNAQDDDCNGQIDDNLGTFTCGLGACMATVGSCAGGVVGTCTPLPAAANDAACNGVDDDCDGAIDEDCACVHVAATGNDANAVTTMNAVPFLTIQAAINWSAATAGVPKIVCVAAGAACGATGTFAGAVTMVDGVSVYGGYESTLFTHCANSTTVIQPGTPEGVLFPNTVVNPTVLDGFRVDRALTSTTAGVTVDGAHSVIVSNVAVTNTPAVTNSYGVNLINGAAALITKSKVDAGAGTGESIGVRSVGSTLTLRNNCLSLDASGHCDDGCGTNPSVRGRTSAGTGVSYAVLLQDSPNSIVEQSALCANDADSGATLRIAGDGTGILVRANSMIAFGGAVDSHGIWMEDCNDAAPWIVDNFRILAAGDTVMTRVDGIRAVGACHPVIDSNIQIAGGGEGGTSGTNAIHCAANSAGVASQCVVLGNVLIQGSTNGFPPTSVGVRCDNDACNRIAGNQQITGAGGVQTWGVWLENTGAVVEENNINGGCGTMASTGVYANDSYSRLENNFILGGRCNVGGVAGNLFIAVDARVGTGGHELDLHSNTIDGGGTPNACSSVAVNLDVGVAPPTGGVGVFRNNILRAGICATSRANFREGNAAADPRVFEHNDLDPFAMPTVLYLDEVSSLVNTAAGVDALTDMTVNGTLSVDPVFVNYPSDMHLQATSMCIAAGTPTGAPTTDFEGDARDPATPDIGADEF